MSVGEFMIGLFEKTSKIFAEDFNVKNVDSLNKALDNIPNRGNADNYDIMVIFNWVY